MCWLPARSIPGSEMLFVEKTRILGPAPALCGAGTRYFPRFTNSRQ
jgi:hypothetical protein